MIDTGYVSATRKKDKTENDNPKKFNGIVVAGTHSGCGKTTVALGLMAALRKKGFIVQPFKAGPDFIDTGIHGLVTGRPSRNLDVWMCGDEYVKEAFRKHVKDADIAVIEGVMGMFDGEGNTAEMAALIESPVVLVVDASGAAESAGAVVRGFVETGEEDYGLKFAGVIFNRVASQKHYERLANSVRGVPVLGYLKKETEFEISHRHLGLVVAEEKPIGSHQINKLADDVIHSINLELLVKERVLSEAATPLKQFEPVQEKPKDDQTKAKDSSFKSKRSKRMRLAIASDQAFSFYYDDNIDMLKNAGFDIVPISPLNDNRIPERVDAIYIGGGYPELYANILSANKSMLKYVREWVEDNKPIYAECGGLIYLSKSVTGFDGKRYRMANVFDFETSMTTRPRLGYREIYITNDCILGKKGDVLRGHEFHYSQITKDDNIKVYNGNRGKAAGCISDSAFGAKNGKLRSVYTARNSRGAFIKDAKGHNYNNALASYIHIHFGSDGRIAGNFMSFVQENTHLQ